MTAFDQAFIKAFSQQARPSVAAPAQPAAPAPRDVDAPISPTAARKSAGQAASTPKPSMFNDVLAALEKPQTPPGNSCRATVEPRKTIERPTVQAAPRRAVVNATMDRGPGGSPLMTPPTRSNIQPPTTVAWPSVVASQPWTATSECCTAVSEPIAAEAEQWAIGTGQWVEASQPWAADARQTVAGLSTPAVEDRPATPWREEESDSKTWNSGTQATADGVRDTWSKPENPEPASVGAAASPAVPPPRIFAPEPAAIQDFKPAWQVDRFTWPRVCRRLIGLAPEELDRLADALMSASADGQKVLAVAGCRRGDGATTLLLCAARRLAERGIRAVLVDADRKRPRLAKRLGVEPQHGWNETSADGDLGLDQAVVEAVTNNLAVAPLRDPSDNHHAAADESSLASCVETLRRHYELVVVDPGPLEAVESIRDSLAPNVEGKIDAVLLVQNRRITSDEDVEEAEQRLAEAGVAVAGLVENFVVS